jgi:hypothetical protein
VSIPGFALKLNLPIPSLPGLSLSLPSLPGIPSFGLACPLDKP